MLTVPLAKEEVVSGCGSRSPAALGTPHWELGNNTVTSMERNKAVRSLYSANVFVN